MIDWVKATREEHAARVCWLFGKCPGGKRSRTAKPGDKVVVKGDGDGFYSEGDTAYLVCQDRDGAWWADFRHNNDFRGMGVWCIGKVKRDFAIITDYSDEKGGEK